MYTLDTNAIIYHLRGEVNALENIKEILQSGVPLYISSLTITELLAFPSITDDEIKGIESVLDTLIVVRWMLMSRAWQDYFVACIKLKLPTPSLRLQHSSPALLL